ncbi:MAG: PAS domain-containing protein [Cellvibrio sp.]|uniref:PAS domain-containing protein n=1 Tax=Cellvibrio sp. TaxID=1965322 RepID=UPI0027186323|nr:PAS domain-containing protein [Cellvibrio sp.]
MKAPLPTYEDERLAHLHQLKILDTARERSFDAIAQLAMNLCQVPIAVVSLVDTDRQWFKSCLGLDATETPRDVAFCAHAILRPDDVLVVEDATIDPRFSDNALVLGEPYIRFYAGAPLVTESGHALGTLCVIDYVPRQLSSIQISSLQLLAGQVMQLLRFRESNMALERERENLDMVIRGTNIGTWQWNVQTGETIFNERWAEIVGYNLDELAPISINTWLDLAHPEDLKKSGELIAQHLRGELAFYDFKCRMRHRDGHWVWVHDRGRVSRLDDSGTPLWMSGTHADISELQSSQKKLRDSEERLQSMLSNFPGAAYRCENDYHWTMLYLSAAVEQLTGYSANDFIRTDSPRSFTDLTHPDDVPWIAEQVQAALVAKTPFELLFRLRHADGRWLWVQEVGLGIYDETGYLKYIDGFIWDVTQTELANKAVQLNEQKLSTLYNQASIGIALNALDDGRYLECNPELCRLTGYTEAELIATSYWDLTPEQYQVQEHQQLESLHASGRYGPYEKEYRHRDGHLIPVLLNGVLIEGPDGERKIWSFIQDITERKRIEQMKNEFVSAVSHELRTPLTSISGSLGLVTSGVLGELPEKVQSMLGIAHKNAKRLTLLINDLLDMEKILAGKMEFDIQEQSLLSILEASLESNKAYADSYGIALVLQVEAGDLHARVDAQRLQQVLTNFISNAVKFSPSEGQVEIRLSQQGDQALIAIVDHGPGISEEFRAHIFQKFSQADSSDSRQRGGTGLGLSISKAFVERMQGRIGFESVVGEGATFYAAFPIVNSAKGPASAL